jgi:hypothetical protein
MKRDGANKPTAIHGLFGLTFHPLENANKTAVWKISSHCVTCGGNHKRQVEARVQTLLEAVDNNSPKRIRPCDLQKLVNSLKLRKACRIHGIPNECLSQLQRRLLVHLTHLINHSFRLSHFLAPWKDAKIIILPKPRKDSKFPQNLRLISLLSTMGKLFEKVILKIAKRDIGEKGLLNARHSTTLQCTQHGTVAYYISILYELFSQLHEAHLLFSS